MKRTLIALACLLALSSTLLAQSASISFNDNSGTPNAGSYNSTATFSIDVFLTLSGFNSRSIAANGLSYFLELPTALAPYISITANTYFTFTDPTQSTVPKTFSTTSGADNGFMSDRIPATGEAGDLGATATDASQNQGDGMFQVTTLTFSVNGAPTGTYNMMTTTVSPKVSEVGDTTFGPGTAIPAALYTITVVPEPSSYVLLFGGLALGGLTLIRSRRRA